LPVVLTYGFAKEHFGSDRSIIGMKAVLNQGRRCSSQEFLRCCARICS
jgi:hypothetical protein